MQLRDVVSVAPRYARAINLERDAGSEVGLHGYVLTTTAEAMLRRVVQSFVDPGRHRAWTLTGPYGSGKSAFLLFLASLLGPASAPGGRFARRLFAEQQPGLFGEARSRRVLSAEGFAPVLVSGSPASIIQSLADSACRDLRSLWAVGRPSAAYRELEHLRQAGGSIAPRQLVRSFVNIAEAVSESSKARGLLIVVDELGRFLEHAAHSARAEEVFVLQELAESTAVSTSPSILLVTVLHQAFEHYVSSLRPGDRQEWAKIQGRFDDVAFQEPPDQVLALIGHAIQHDTSASSRALRKHARAQASRAVELELVPNRRGDTDYVRILESCAPLHPLVALSLARLCRKFGQNQRSLFSFLTSREPHGFASFLDRPFDNHAPAFYSLPELYDYAVETFGSALSVGIGASRWAEAQTAVERAAAFPLDEIRLVKSIGLLSALGAHGHFKAGSAVLAFSASGSASSVKNSLDSLLRQSIIVERKHSGTFGLWEGSDVDLDERFSEALRRLPGVGALARRANQQWRPRPLVAKRHSYQTGTLRYCEVLFADQASLTDLLQRPLEGDAVLLYALPSTAAEREGLVAMATTSAIRDRGDVIVAVPENAEAFLAAVRQLEGLRWVQAHTPQLENDAVARRELRSRIGLAEASLRLELRHLFSPEQPAASTTDWFHRGMRKVVGSSKNLSGILSDVCDSLYSLTPVLRNELVNRRTLSTAAAAARRNLIDAMIHRSATYRLGFEGTPPEVSIYSSLLEHTGIHRQSGAEYGFGQPTSDLALSSAWREIEKFFDECEVERRSVTHAFEILQRPPFGLKMGLIPVLLCAALLAHDNEVALYEEGAFLPQLTVEAFERLMRSPEKYSVRRYRVGGVRREVFEQLSGLFGSQHRQDATTRLADVVRSLYRFLGRLPPYSQKTKDVSPRAIAVRDALLSAKEPDTLLFDTLPHACGLGQLPAGEGGAGLSLDFVAALRDALLELQRAYDELLASIRRLLLRAFSLGDGGTAELQIRAAALKAHCVDGRLLAFVCQLEKTELTDVSWLESLSAALVGKPPRTWTDIDRAKYEIALAETSRAFRHLEALVFEDIKHSSTPGTEFFRIGVSDRHRGEYESVVAIEPADQELLAATVRHLREVLGRADALERPQFALAALATICREYLTALETGAPGAKGRSREGAENA